MPLAVMSDSLIELRLLIRRYLAVQMSLLPLTLERIRIYGQSKKTDTAYQEFDLEVQACLYAFSEHKHEPRLRMDLRKLIDR